VICTEWRFWIFRFTQPSLFRIEPGIVSVLNFYFELNFEENLRDNFIKSNFFEWFWRYLKTKNFQDILLRTNDIPVLFLINFFGKWTKTNTLQKHEELQTMPTITKQVFSYNGCVRQINWTAAVKKLVIYKMSGI